MPRLIDWFADYWRETLVAMACIIVIALYLCPWKWTAVFTPIFAVFLLALFVRLFTYRDLRRLNGEYSHHKFTDDVPLQGKMSHVRFGLRNMLRPHPILFVDQKSKEHGDWESELIVTDLNPRKASGFYKYTEAGNGVRKGDWGVHELHTNPDAGVIHVKATSKGRPGENEYLLKKISSS